MPADKPALKKALMGLAGFLGAIVVVAVLIKVDPELFPPQFRHTFPWAAGALIGLVVVSALATALMKKD